MKLRSRGNHKMRTKYEVPLHRRKFWRLENGLTSNTDICMHVHKSLKEIIPQPILNFRGYERRNLNVLLNIKDPIKMNRLYQRKV